MQLIVNGDKVLQVDSEGALLQTVRWLQSLRNVSALPHALDAGNLVRLDSGYFLFGHFGTAKTAAGARGLVGTALGPGREVVAAPADLGLTLDLAAVGSQLHMKDTNTKSASKGRPPDRPFGPQLCELKSNTEQSSCFGSSSWSFSGSPDAICLAVDKAGAWFKGITVSHGEGRTECTLELKEITSTSFGFGGSSSSKTIAKTKKHVVNSSNREGLRNKPYRLCFEKAVPLLPKTKYTLVLTQKGPEGASFQNGHNA